MLAILLLVIHILAAVLICIVILMQSSKGEGLSGAFGMGQGTTSFFGADTANVLVKITTVLAVIFMLTSLSLAYVQAQQAKSVTAEEGVKPEKGDSLTVPPQDGEEGVRPEGETTPETEPAEATTEPATGGDTGTVTPPEDAAGTGDAADTPTDTGPGGAVDENPDESTDTGPDQPTEPGGTDS
jgi:preprotein translocase subunit SecG